MSKKDELLTLLSKIESDNNTFYTQVVTKLTELDSTLAALVNAVSDDLLDGFADINLDLEDAKTLLSEIEEAADDSGDDEEEETLTEIVSVGFDGGSFTELTNAGGEVVKRTGCTATIVYNPTDSTTKCAKLTIPGAGASYLFIDKAGVLPDHGRVSAKLYIPNGEPLSTTSWWNIFQLKSTVNGSTDSSVPMFNVDCLLTKTYVNYRPDLEFGAGKVRTNLGLVLPRAEWFELMLEYVADATVGKIVLYLNGIEIYRDETHPTLYSTSDRVLWSVNDYAGSGTSEKVNNPCSIYVDDMKVYKIE